MYIIVIASIHSVAWGHISVLHYPNEAPFSTYSAIQGASPAVPAHKLTNLLYVMSSGQSKWGERWEERQESVMQRLPTYSGTQWKAKQCFVIYTVSYLFLPGVWIAIDVLGSVHVVSWWVSPSYAIFGDICLPTIQCKYTPVQYETNISLYCNHIRRYSLFIWLLSN